jgi:ParB-like chromosome segregation protein Spo0J
MTTIKPSFLLEPITLPLEKLLPSRTLKPGIKATSRYKMIEASVREVGLIEALIVFPQGKSGTYVLLDGHVRLEVLRDLERRDVTCLVATDDENATYNQEVSRLAPIQENRMILKAIDEGVPEERIAKALNVAVKTIRENKTRLADICADAIEALKDKPISEMALRQLKKAKPYRQVEMAELMTLSNTYSASYAKAMIMMTPPDQLAEPTSTSTRPEQLTKLENEMRALERDFVVLDESYSRDTLNLQLARAYVKTLLQNPKVARHLEQKHGELFTQLQNVVDATSLDA